MSATLALPIELCENLQAGIFWRPFPAPPTWLQMDAFLRPLTSPKALELIAEHQGSLLPPPLPRLLLYSPQTLHDLPCAYHYRALAHAIIQSLH